MINKVMEEKYVPITFDSHFSGYSYEVVIVEDNSPDGTYEVAVELQVWHPCLQSIYRVAYLWFREDYYPSASG